MLDLPKKLGNLENLEILENQETPENPSQANLFHNPQPEKKNIYIFQFFSLIKVKQKKNDKDDILWKQWKEKAPKICTKSFPIEKKTFPTTFHNPSSPKNKILTP